MAENGFSAKNPHRVKKANSLQFYYCEMEKNTHLVTFLLTVPPEKSRVKTAFLSTCLVLISLTFSAFAATQAGEDGAYLNSRLFSSGATSLRTIAEQEIRAFIAITGLPSLLVYSIKQADG